MSETIIAVDIGGTKLAVGLVDHDGVLTHEHQCPTPSTERIAIPDEAEELWETLAGLVDALPADSGATAVGVGTGGPMQRGGRTVSPLNIRQWREFPLLDRLRSHTGLDVFIDNDAKALALAEGWRGAARGVDNYIGMVVSTGVGGGIVLDGRLLDGAASNAGHIGHVIVDPEGRELPNHVRGSLEAEASGTAIRHHTGRPAAEATADVVARTGTMVGRAVGSVANLLDLKLAVVAGSVALGFGDPFFAAAQVEIDRVCQLDHSLGTRIVPAELGAKGPLTGAAAVALVGQGHQLLQHPTP